MGGSCRAQFTDQEARVRSACAATLRAVEDFVQV